MKTCENCGERVYNLGCTWCNEEAYIEEQSRLDALYDEEDDEPEYVCLEDTCVCTDGMCGDSADED